MVIEYTRSGVALADAQVGQQTSHWFGFHWPTPVSMKGQFIAANLLFGAALANQPLAQQPTDPITTEDIQDDVQVVVLPFESVA